jgi:hypothetical protein
MAQSDINVGNQTAPLFRTDLNNALEALATNSSGTSAPSTLFGYMFWYDSTNNILKLNLSGTWVSIGKFDTGSNTFLPYIGSTQITALLDEDTLSSNSATAVATQQSIKAYVDNNGVGKSQTWQDVKASRSVGTSYQNTTGNPIYVNIQNSGSIDGESVQVSQNGSTWVTLAVIDADTDATNISFVVPNGHYYRITGTGTVGYWSELR